MFNDLHVTNRVSGWLYEVKKSIADQNLCYRWVTKNRVSFLNSTIFKF